ncbi:bifunctional DNA-binding transcriptional regulator/O6-methylguanine-DNA methyltransferase Ada [Proteus faecis]|uniref:Bifunctional DNA-binding transcriptional regulator/O6-methylguanine-DNA methyltransferase Ada n=1 Tax=Proteus faecis TaxID=2050967 RepID=A0AAW7CJ80_9GAMM|nr:bifunctional DNA-binding transcriptional regulator/O6-methylguanine-DNA methyltransferase Ada [Proteus faecis]MBG3012602.1 bifunctional DNA-binding transcriptional regulator/O6-methylguanine-DNA methyltransferase Ada [Proteus mirabilis]MDL5166255.1 bifunctional DNA-binding transcriptional regulator/O6-methylguanine-DNA methyltransferase Ada [Proteus faecis]MDL5273481.1 bifunctional DNA-binding transcriptional regulator/O6-methylguanine-DNA methyltransferase Ada [Proteus faecis]MDL5277051.1 b
MENKHNQLIEQACRFIEKNNGDVSLASIAKHVMASPYHFHRLFKSTMGITPKDYANAYRQKLIKKALVQDGSITDAIYQSGFNANSRFYENAKAILGMTPTNWRTGGKNIAIFFAIAQCSLGSILVAQSEKGICAIMLGDDAELLLDDLQKQFPLAELIGANEEFEQIIAQVIGFIELPQQPLSLPLDIQGTVFQQKVWRALLDIPFGSTMTYQEIANKIGAPKAYRAVANACAANKLAVAIPCHRVIRQNGELSGYRWGIERKAKLLQTEALNNAKLGKKE